MPGLCFSDHFTQGCSEDRRIPLLRDVFQAFPELPINVDIKVDNDRLIQEVCVPLVRTRSAGLKSDR